MKRNNIYLQTARGSTSKAYLHAHLAIFHNIDTRWSLLSVQGNSSRPVKILAPTQPKKLFNHSRSAAEVNFLILNFFGLY